MRRIRRPLALVSAILFQLMLVVGAYGCTVTGGPAAGAASMAGMAMPPSGEGAAPANTGGSELPCQLPSNGCQSMAPCTVASIVVASAEPGLAGAPPASGVTTLELLVPASISIAPELPPPRA